MMIHDYNTTTTRRCKNSFEIGFYEFLKVHSLTIIFEWPTLTFNCKTPTDRPRPNVGHRHRSMCIDMVAYTHIERESMVCYYACSYMHLKKIKLVFIQHTKVACFPNKKFVSLVLKRPSVALTKNVEFILVFL